MFANQVKPTNLFMKRRYPNAQETKKALASELLILAVVFSCMLPNMTAEAADSMAGAFPPAYNCKQLADQNYIPLPFDHCKHTRYHHFRQSDFVQPTAKYTALHKKHRCSRYDKKSSSLDKSDWNHIDSHRSARYQGQRK